MPEIRLATAADVVSIVRMGLRFIRETVYAGTITENPEQMARLALQLIEGELDGVLFVAVDADDAAIGMVGALHFLHPLSCESMVSELFWFVDNEHRGTTGVRLLRALTTWAKERGAVGLTMIAPTPDVEAIYEKRGFQRVETSYMQRL